MREVLILTHHFIPYTHSLGGVSRVLNLILFLQKNNINVHLIAARGIKASNFGYNKISNLCNISYINDPIKNFLDKRRNLNSTSYEITKNPGFKFKEIIKNLLPTDLAIIMFPIYLLKSIQLIKERNIKHIIISCPPHSLSITGYFLKIIFKGKISFILDYRDSWNMTDIHHSKFKIINMISFFIEKRILKSCDYFLYATKPMLKKLTQNINFDISRKSKLVMNGYTNKPSIKFSPSSGRIKIGYFGSADSNPNGYRNINLFLDLIYLNKLSHIFEIHIFGSYDLNISKFKRENFIFTYEALSHTSALNKMTQMDYLLLLHTNQTNGDEVITGKFFDYVISQRPIICFSCSNMEAMKIITKHNLGYFINYRDPDLNLLKNLEKNPEYRPSNFDIRKFHRDTQFKKILPLINEKY